jgi:hypothetical protein
MTPPRLACFGLFVAVSVWGCTPNTVYFSEGTSVGFRAEFKPDASEPLSSSLAYKRRIVAVVPPEHPNVASYPDWVSGNQNIHKGEALSVVSIFAVDATATQGLTIENNFLSGRAAEIATGSDPVSTIAAMTGSLGPVTQAIQDRRVALAGQVRTMQPDRALRILTTLGIPGPIQKDQATFVPSKQILAAQNQATLDSLDAAFNANP